MNKFTVTLAGLRKAGACFNGYNKVVRALQGKEFTEKDEERESYIRFAHKDPIGISAILDSNGLDDALWALRCIENADKDKNVRLFAVWCARQVEHLMTDQRSKDALNVAERHANEQSTDEELSAARSAAMAAAWAAARDAAWDAAMDAARSAAMDAARSAAMDAARSAAMAAARSAAMAAARSAAMAAARSAARDAAWDAAMDAARSAARSAAWAAAMAAARDAAWDAAMDAARSAAMDAARSAAMDAARDAQKYMLIKMLEGNAPWQV